ncbi:cyclase family protein [Photobacterium sp. SDRW27]|uniref:cyclase family protein n=1 Tax=Photobacterium obscurum TaxID=2829490 RepID=UPI002243DEA7|nr:cyclase family protein [Photobacterium obscurum]MCW8328924.1 cyclase family protein [Photobacterium obscurum]
MKAQTTLHIPVSLEINEEHPAYQWAKQHSDSVNALGHIGTHIDCYTKVPQQNHYSTEAVIIDCSERMPNIEQITALALTGKSLVLYTANLEKNGYGNKDYGDLDTTLDTTVLDAILQQSPAFIVIDSYGIGAHGDEHIRFDKRCEEHGCFVIENVVLTKAMLTTLTALDIEFDKIAASTGKRCEVTAILT